MLHGKVATALLTPRVGEELAVFARAARAAQRRWAKAIAAREGEVRRLMTVEDHHRARLRRCVLRRTLHGLRFLVNTDLLAAAQEVAPPPLDAFVAYALPASCVTPFAVYAMAHLRARPDRVRVPPLTLIADLQGAWAVLPPCRRAVYDDLARAYRDELRRREAAAAAAAAKTQDGNNGSKSGKVAAARRRVRDVAREAAARRQQQTRRRPSSEEVALLSLSSSAATWERDAFARFARQSLRQSRRALDGDGARVDARAWAPIARAEWATMSLRQKRSYTREVDDGDENEE